MHEIAYSARVPFNVTQADSSSLWGFDSARLAIRNAAGSRAGRSDEEWRVGAPRKNPVADHTQFEAAASGRELRTTVKGGRGFDSTSSIPRYPRPALSFVRTRATGLRSVRPRAQNDEKVLCTLLNGPAQASWRRGCLRLACSIFESSAIPDTVAAWARISDCVHVIRSGQR